ncbi:MAG: 50S ribosome-binding GTPase, partial [Planctomycetes bacterium]|nr:50S ribosome-binding GTPase [Planctomycetota bacterium]
MSKLKSQLSSVVSELEQLQRASGATLEEQRRRLDRFSVTLFGRTMAGKSTLMEILTRGDGRSIGTGAQRTTRDVRAYEWNGLEVTDVPGVAAFEGAQDEELAFKAASRADLVLFLITDDAPQPVEAECLARVRRLGKPVLGICNVKVAVDDEDDLLLFLRSPDKPFAEARLAPLLQQFHAFADRHVPGKRVPFAATHLRSRYLAEHAEYARHSERLRAASRFDRVESWVVREVVGRGTFMRVKSFIDSAGVPMMDLADALLEFSAENSSSGRVLIDKSRQFREWSRGFRRHGDERITTLVSEEMESLRDEVPAFAEIHYEDGSAGENWVRVVESAGINRKVERLQTELLADCTKALSEVARELKTELALVASLSGDRRITMDSIVNAKKAWNWSVFGVGTGLGLAALILGSGPLGWAAGAVGVVGWLVSLLFDDRETKATRAREKLTNRLLRDIDSMEEHLREKLGDWFHRDLMDEQVNVFLGDLSAVTNGLFGLADAQRTLAWALNDRYKVLWRTLVGEALSRLGTENLSNAVVDVARVPGLATMLLIEPTATIPAQTRAGLEQLLGEQVWLVLDTGSHFSILSQAIGRECDRNSIAIERKIRVAHVPLDDLGPIGRARVRLAQQLTGLHV